MRMTVGVFKFKALFCSFLKWHCCKDQEQLYQYWLSTMGMNLNTSKPKTWRDSLFAYRNPIAFFICEAALCFVFVTSPLSLSSPVFHRIDTAIDLTGTEGRNNIRILKLNHFLLCAWMSIGSHGKCWWRQMWNVPVICTQCLGLFSVLQLFLVWKWIKNTKKKKKKASLTITRVN